VDVDPVSGRKIINQYEVMDELGRGVHGKVKLGRNLETGQTVAIKIVDRYSKKKRLNRDTSREDKIKEEIAILKKARHPNIVSLLEVIDDPSRKKVYIVLEHVELGEVRWRVVGEKEICLIEWRRYQRESQGVLNHESASIEDEQIINLAHKKLAKQQRRTAKLLRKHRLGHDGNEPWSLELGGESDEELPGSLGSGIGSGRTSRASTRSAAEGPSKHKFAEYHAKGAHVHASSVGTGARSPTPFSSKSQDTDASTALEGTMYGAYDSDFMRGRTSSLAESSSSHFSLEEDDVPEHFRWVPLLTLQNALETFRDTVLGLEFLHFQGVVHRDIKPANLLQTKERRVKISDFGVSYLGRVRLETDDIEESESDMHDAEAIELAKTVGTPAFYAPELCKLDDDGDPFPVSKQIDVWALGVTLYCLIYGRVPFHSTSEFHLMKTIVDEEVFIPRYRLKAVAEQSGSRPSSHGRMYHSMSTDKRLPHELEYEEVDDLLRDLLKRLLVKDPRRRITIPEIKLHPWVLQGLDNFDVWMEQTDPARTSQGKRIEVSKEDMDQAVVPVTLIERVRSGIRKGFESLVRVGTGRSSTRKRAESTATSPDPHHNLSAHSSSSTISQESRRPSLALSQSIFETLSRSRESDHPLSQSVSASPEARDRAKFFESDSRTGSPAYAIESHEYVAPLTTSPRPFGLERGHSDMSSAASVRTIRASDMCPSGRSLSPQIPPAAAGTPTTLEPPSASSLSGILGSVPRLVNTMRSRERLTRSSRRPLDQARAKSDYLGDISDDPHGGPSVALSTAFASGQVDQPDVLKDLSPRATRSRGPSVSEVRSPDPLDKGSSRDSSVSSVSSYFNRPVTYRHRTTDLVCSTESNLHPVKERETPSEANADVEDNRYRRMAEDNECRDNHVASECHRPTPARAPSHCPPSPDDFMSMPSQRQKVEDYLKNGQGTDHNISLEHYQPPKALASSSSEDFPTSLSQSTSNPSIPSVVSATSSVAPDDYSGMRSAYREVHSTYDNAIMNKYALSPSDSFDQLGESTDDPAGYDGDGDHPLDSDYDDDSDDDFIVMGKKKPTPAPARSSNSISNAELARKEVRKSYHTERRRSARSGSNGTVRKIPSDPVSGKQDDTR
jgi:[calcium/calmodulin-dependent protein kinase] kinase